LVTKAVLGDGDYAIEVARGLRGEVDDGSLDAAMRTVDAAPEFRCSWRSR
jgi:hypothetical protein